MAGMFERLKRMLQFLETRPKGVEPNCYGLAWSLVTGVPDSFRSPEKVWEELEMVGEVRIDRGDFSAQYVGDLFSKEVEFLVFTNPYSPWFGRMNVDHVVANKPDGEGRVLHRRECGCPVERVSLRKLVEDYEGRGKGYVVVGFRRKR